MTPADALRDLVARVGPLDPVSETVATVAVDGVVFDLTPRVAAAFVEALARYTDPNDFGRCAACAGPLDRHLACAGCGRIEGIFGATIADHVARRAAG